MGTKQKSNWPNGKDVSKVRTFQKQRKEDLVPASGGNLESNKDSEANRGSWDLGNSQDFSHELLSNCKAGTSALMEICTEWSKKIGLWILQDFLKNQAAKTQ